MKYKLILVKNRKKYLEGGELKEDQDYITLASASTEEEGICCRWFTLTSVIGKKMSDEYYYRSHGWSNFDFKIILRLREIELYFIKDHSLNNKIDWNWFETHIIDFNAQRAPFTDSNLFWITISGV